MFLQFIFYALLDAIVRPRYLGCCIWFMIGMLLIGNGTKNIKAEEQIDSLLTETICTVEAKNGQIAPSDIGRYCYSSDIGEHPCSPASCLTYDVSYTPNSKMYSATINTRPSGIKCFNRDLLEVHQQYYCWYRTDSPEVVYLAKNNLRTYKSAAFLGLLILLLSGTRLIYLLLQKEPLSTPRQETPLDMTDNKQVSSYLFTTIVNAFLGLGIFMGALGALSGLGLMFYAGYSFYTHYEDIPVMCTVKENQGRKLKVSYPVKELTYTTTIDPDINNRSVYPVNSTLPCYYSKENPFAVAIESNGQYFWITLLCGLATFVVSGLMSLLFWWAQKAINSSRLG